MLDLIGTESVKNWFQRFLLGCWGKNGRKKPQKHTFLGSTRMRSLTSNRKYLCVSQEFCSWKETRHHHTGGTLSCSVTDISSPFFSLLIQILNCYFLEIYGVLLYAFPNSPKGGLFFLSPESWTVTLLY